MFSILNLYCKCHYFKYITSLNTFGSDDFWFLVTPSSSEKWLEILFEKWDELQAENIELLFENWTYYSLNIMEKAQVLAKFIQLLDRRKFYGVYKHFCYASVIVGSILVIGFCLVFFYRPILNIWHNIKICFFYNCLNQLK